MLTAGALLIGVLPGGSASVAESATPLLKPYGGEAVVGDAQEPSTLNTFVPGGDNFIVTKIGQATWTGVQDITGSRWS